MISRAAITAWCVLSLPITSGFIVSKPMALLSATRPILDTTSPRLWGMQMQAQSGGEKGDTSLWAATTLDQDVVAGPTARVTYRGPTEISAGDEVTIVYRPSLPDMGGDDGAQPLIFMGGFNGWDGEEQPLILPAVPGEAGDFEVNLHIPNFAKVVDFIFSDGTRFDTNDGDYYHLRIRNVQEVDKDGNVAFFSQEEDGTLRPTGEMVQRDARELERMIDQELGRRAATGPNTPMMSQEEEQQDAWRREEEERERRKAVQKLRAEAQAVGERLGLGRIMVNEARDVFDRFDDDETATLPREQVGAALDKLGFDMDPKESAELVGRHAQEGEEQSISLTTWMHMFAELDSQDVGIDII